MYQTSTLHDWNGADTPAHPATRTAAFALVQSSRVFGPGGCVVRNAVHVVVQTTQGPPICRHPTTTSPRIFRTCTRVQSPSGGLQATHSGSLPIWHWQSRQNPLIWHQCKLPRRKTCCGPCFTCSSTTCNPLVFQVASRPMRACSPCPQALQPSTETAAAHVVHHAAAAPAPPSPEPEAPAAPVRKPKTHAD